MDMTNELKRACCFDPEGQPRTWAELLAQDPQTQAEWLGPTLQKLAAAKSAPKRKALRNGEFVEVPDHEVDYELADDAAQFGSRVFGPHINLIPLQSSVAGPRLFYGARFFNQALPLVGAEAPLVQNMSDQDGRSYDELMGDAAGNLRSTFAGTVKRVDPEEMELDTSEGPKKLSLYRNFPFNRKTNLTHVPAVKPGDAVQPGQLLAHSNYTDKDGALAMGLNARIGLVPYKGRSMDDALVISDAFARRLKSEHLYCHDLDYKRGVEGGKHKHMGYFPNKFTKAQLDTLDDDGVIKPGMVLQPGDPLILATKPRVISSASAQLGQLSKAMRNARQDASLVWDHESPGEVVDVEKLRNGVKVNIKSVMSAQVGDKLTASRSGQKGVISHIISSEHMPRTVDGQPLEMLINPLGLPSRVNNSLVYEALLGKAALKNGRPYKLPAFNRPDENWFDFVQQELDKVGLKDTEEVFDPQIGRKLENPITVGNLHVLKLHHQAESKMSVRGQGSYTSESVPSHGGGEGALAKRMSGLESHALLSAGAYNVLREGATLRGSRNDSYWKTLRMGQTPPDPGHPFVWDKFQALLSGAGYQARKLPHGVRRLTFFTDKDLEAEKPIEIQSGDMVDLGTLEPTKGGLFDNALTAGNKWGAITLPFPVVNPAAESAVRHLLGLTEKQFRAVMAGEAELPEHLTRKK